MRNVKNSIRFGSACKEWRIIVHTSVNGDVYDYIRSQIHVKLNANIKWQVTIGVKLRLEWL